VYMKNLIINHIETPNRRLWALRESMHFDEVNFAQYLNMTFEEYHQYEKADSSVPKEFLQNVADEFSIPVEWLFCECPILPIPKPKKQK
ncbi:MAG: helix-turn-helix domain-containing protein, partial [bacterium]